MLSGLHQSIVDTRAPSGMADHASFSTTYRLALYRSCSSTVVSSKLLFHCLSSKPVFHTSYVDLNIEISTTGVLLTQEAVGPFKWRVIFKLSGRVVPNVIA